MHEIFVNYRTKGGKELAYLCDRALTSRFGPDAVFLARRSIGLGNDYAETLLRAARHCQALLVLISEEWLEAPDRNDPGGRALDDPEDWVRREIEEALAAEALVVPVFTGRKVEQLPPGRLPRSIAALATRQYTRLELSRFDYDMEQLANRLTRQLPGLAMLDAIHARAGVPVSLREPVGCSDDRTRRRPGAARHHRTA
ncbi:TIR domain-containing protein [Streptomyces niveiscabiei]|uniref:TIR domain-containing protein n=1 Tax=Streptomyces niveiscabiei TaxID=164115 RepID=A0ABW9I2T5_9ACTN